MKESFKLTVSDNSFVIDAPKFSAKIPLDSVQRILLMWREIIAPTFEPSLNWAIETSEADWFLPEDAGVLTRVNGELRPWLIDHDVLYVATYVTTPCSLSSIRAHWAYFRRQPLRLQPGTIKKVLAHADFEGPISLDSLCSRF